MEKPSGPALTGVRKRQQIENTNKRIFIWLAVSSIIISFCIVALQFLVKEFMFNQKVIGIKSDTNQQLIKNVTAAAQLKSNINELIADTNLSSVMTQTNNAKASNLNAILDALPTAGDATGFANSLQTVVLTRSGVSLRELGTNLEGTELTPEDASVSNEVTQPVSLPFKASFSGSYVDTQKALTDLAHVIRPISLTQLSIRSDDNNQLQVTIDGQTYYLPARTVEVKTKVLKP